MSLLKNGAPVHFILSEILLAAMRRDLELGAIIEWPSMNWEDIRSHRNALRRVLGSHAKVAPLGKSPGMGGSLPTLVPLRNTVPLIGIIPASPHRNLARPRWVLGLPSSFNGPGPLGAFLLPHFLVQIP